MNKAYFNKRLLISVLIAAVLALPVFGVVWVSNKPPEPIGADTVILPSQLDTNGYARAVGPWPWEFPRDHGPHPAFQTEWWYYTGNLTSSLRPPIWIPVHYLSPCRDPRAKRFPIGMAHKPDLHGALYGKRRRRRHVLPRRAV